MTLASDNEKLYKVELCGVADIAYLVRDKFLQVLSSTDGTIDFWFSHNRHLQVNPCGTELLMATTRFTARDVPLLRGSIVITSHDSAGNPASLTDDHMDRLINSLPSWREDRILRRRVSRDLRGSAAAARKAFLKTVIDRQHD